MGRPELGNSRHGGCLCAQPQCAQMNGAGIVLDQPTHLSLCEITLWPDGQPSMGLVFLPSRPRHAVGQPRHLFHAMGNGART